MRVAAQLGTPFLNSRCCAAIISRRRPETMAELSRSMMVGKTGRETGFRTRRGSRDLPKEPQEGMENPPVNGCFPGFPPGVESLEIYPVLGEGRRPDLWGRGRG